MEVFQDKKRIYEEWVRAGQQGVPIKEPVMPKEVDARYDAGSTTGLGQLLNDTDGRAVWLKHETRKLVKKLCEGTTIGSFDEINQIMEHAYYRNAPVNSASKFCVENTHLVALWLMHLEETWSYYIVVCMDSFCSCFLKWVNLSPDCVCVFFVSLFSAVKAPGTCANSRR